MKTLSILLYGDFTWDRLGASFGRAFEKLGHRIIPIDTRELEHNLAPWLRHRIGHRLTIRNLVLRRRGSQAWNQRLLDTVTAQRLDLVLLLNGDFVMPETIDKIRTLGVPVAIFHADNPFPPFPNNRPETLLSALACDHYYTWSKSLIPRLQAYGVKRVEYLPFAWDPLVFPTVSKPALLEYDVVFVGGWDRDREDLLTPLARLFDLKIWGPSYWRDRTRLGSPLRHCWQGSALTGQDAARVQAHAKVNLNLLRAQNLPDGTNMRTFEVPGCGGFLLSTRTLGAMEVYPEGIAAAYFDDSTECVNMINFYLKYESKRDEIIKQAHKITLTGHQYTDRAHRILSDWRIG
jgi:hypothetical protein